MHPATNVLVSVSYPNRQWGNHMSTNKKVVFLTFSVLFLIGLILVQQPFSAVGDSSTQITPTAHVTTTPKPPPGPSSTPTATAVDADYLPVIIRPYTSPTIGPTPTALPTGTPKPPPGRL